MMIQRTLRRVAPLALLLPALTGCATQEQLKTYEDEISSLRERNSKLQRENDQLHNELDMARAQVAEATMQIREAETAPSYPSLEGMGVDVSLRGDSVVISIPSSITFASGSAQLSPAGQDAVRAVARVLGNDYPRAKYWIEGHTDSQQPSKSAFDSNRDLSVARAMNVLEFMVNSCGIADGSCVVAGHGEYSPLGTNDTNDGMARNRRVEIVVQNPR